MTIYNILFPFLIIVALGIAIFILTKHLPEAIEENKISEREEKKRWWQTLLGKGENLLRSLRVLILKIDNKLNDSIKKVREKKEKMGEGLREYRVRHKEKVLKEEALISAREGQVNSKTEIQEPEEIALAEKYPAQEATKEKKEAQPDSETAGGDQRKKSFSGFAEKVSSVFRDRQSGSNIHPPKKTVEEILKKTFTPTELKVEKEQYWKKKEEMLIQSIVRDSKNVGLYLQLGRLYSNQHNWKDARNAFLEALKLDKTNIKAKEELKRIDKYLNN